MNSKWSLEELFANFHDKVEAELNTARKLGHPTDKGDASEQVWIDVLNRYLPRRYEARKGFIVDSLGKFSHQIDVIIHDRQYSPFVFRFKETDIVPAESVYAILEAKQDMNATNIEYASRKANSVRELHRTTLSTETIHGSSPQKPLHHILSGIVTLTTTWRPPLGDTLSDRLCDTFGPGVLDIGCIADSGWFSRLGNQFDLHTVDKAATRFLFELMYQLQRIGTVPALDIQAYALRI